MSVLVFLHDDYADWELGYVLPELRSSATDPRIDKKPREVRTFSLDGRPVRSMGGLRVTPDLALDALGSPDVDALILPGGTFWRDVHLEPLRDLVTGILERGTCVAGICAATGFLASLGALDAVPHTSNTLGFLKERAPGYRGEAFYRDALAVRHGSVITASGLGAIDFTREVLRALDVYPAPILDVWYRAFKHGEDPFREGAR